MKQFGETSNLLLCLSVCICTCLSLGYFFYILFCFILFFCILCHVFVLAYPLLWFLCSVCMFFALYILPWPKKRYSWEIHEADLQFDHVISCNIELRFDIDATRGLRLCASRALVADRSRCRMIALRINLMNNSAVTICSARVVHILFFFFLWGGGVRVHCWRRERRVGRENITIIVHACVCVCVSVCLVMFRSVAIKQQQCFTKRLHQECGTFLMKPFGEASNLLCLSVCMCTCLSPVCFLLYFVLFFFSTFNMLRCLECSTMV